MESGFLEGRRARIIDNVPVLNVYVSLFCFGSFICIPLHVAMAAAVPLLLAGQRWAFLYNLVLPRTSLCGYSGASPPATHHPHVKVKHKKEKQRKNIRYILEGWAGLILLFTLLSPVILLWGLQLDCLHVLLTSLSSPPQLDLAGHSADPGIIQEL